MHRNLITGKRSPSSYLQTAFRPAAAALVGVLCVFTARAHVKWFVDFDVSKPPLPVGEVINGTFVTLLLVSAVAVYLFFLTDRYIYKKGYLAAFDQRLRRFDGFAGHVMRISTGIFFISLWVWYLVHGTTFYITPELTATSAYVPWLHLVLGLLAFSRYTAPVSGMGIFVLYGAAVHDFGIFHMLDYLIFLGIGYFLIASSLRHATWIKSGFVVLFACTGLTLIWASVEKFGYAEWTYPLLDKDPGMLMGMLPKFYMTLTGFVEFNVTFILLGAVSVVGRLVSLAMMSIFVLAVFKFGTVDAIGHLMIVAILFVLIVRGPTDARNMLELSTKSVWTEAYFMTGLYFLAFVMIFILYYGLHFVIFGV